MRKLVGSFRGIPVYEDPEAPEGMVYFLKGEIKIPPDETTIFIGPTRCKCRHHWVFHLDKGACVKCKCKEFRDR